MPAATTHIEFARDVLDILPAEERKRITNLPMYYLGSQGPDFFFFSNYVVLPGTLYRCGSVMHEQKTAALLDAMRRLCAHSGDLYSYYCGFLCHYALDSSAHPLIRYFASKEAKETGVKEIEAHFREEGMIDVHVLKLRGRTPLSYSVYRDLAVSRSDARDLGAMFRLLFREVYGWDIPAAKIEHTAAVIVRMTRWLKPGSELKYTIADKAENLLKKPKLVTGMMLAHKEKDFIEVLNENHVEHEVPGQPGVTDSRSFDEIYAEALPLAGELIAELRPEEITKDFEGRLIV